ncbi:hypothetical protein D8S78_09035 [Natrialba swarupiae]|nr:hypothetical protein [Natrialba swarupiae]
MNRRGLRIDRRRRHRANRGLSRRRFLEEDLDVGFYLEDGPTVAWKRDVSADVVAIEATPNLTVVATERELLVLSRSNGGPVRRHVHGPIRGIEEDDSGGTPTATVACSRSIARVGTNCGTRRELPAAVPGRRRGRLLCVERARDGRVRSRNGRRTLAVGGEHDLHLLPVVWTRSR